MSRYHEQKSLRTSSAELKGIAWLGQGEMSWDIRWGQTRSPAHVPGGSLSWLGAPHSHHIVTPNIASQGFSISGWTQSALNSPNFLLITKIMQEG